MKDKLKKITERDKVILVIFAFFLAFAGLYLLHGKVQEERIALEQEGSILEEKRKIALESGMALEGLEKLIKAKGEELAEIYRRVPDDISNSIEFEQLFLGWIKGRNVKVESFSYTKPITERVVMPNINENPENQGGESNPLDLIASQVDNLNGLPSSQEYEEEDDTDSQSEYFLEDEAPVTTNSQVEIPPIMVSKYSYQLQLSRYEYTRLLDKINNESEFYHIQSTEFNEAEDGIGRATLNINVYAYSKPASYKKR